MSSTIRRFGEVAACLALLSAGMAFAHHGDARRYEMAMRTITGTVVDFKFVNPHSLLILDVPGASGQIERWQCETGAPNNLRRQGFMPDAIRVGDTITVTGRQRRNGEPYLSITGGAAVYDAAGRQIYHGE